MSVLVYRDCHAVVKMKAQHGGLLEHNAEWKNMAAGESVQYDSKYKELKM